MEREPGVIVDRVDGEPANKELATLIQRVATWLHDRFPDLESFAVEGLLNDSTVTGTAQITDGQERRVTIVRQTPLSTEPTGSGNP